jgi:hypothetical protein
MTLTMVMTAQLQREPVGIPAKAGIALRPEAAGREMPGFAGETRERP